MHKNCDQAAERRPAAPLLLVDDEKDFLEALAFRLESRGLPALLALNGEEAMALLTRPELEVVLLDLNMPGVSGLELLPLIKKQRPDLEVLLLTGESDLALAARGMRRGASDYLLKPVDLPTLLTSIHKARQRAFLYRERLRATEAGRLVALGSLAHGVGHEINNPLQGIVQGAEWLCELIEDSRAGLPLPLDEVEKSAQTILAQARLCAGVTAQLLDLAHRARSNTAETDLRDLLGKLVERMRPRAESLRVRLDLELAEALPLLPCSQAEMEPVLFQLVANALDAVEAAIQQGRTGGHLVRLGAGQAEGLVRITVSDTGDGIAPEHAERIYDPFFSTRPVGKGAGLGLTICHSLVTMLRGRLQHAPASPRGTLLTLELPLDAAKQA